MSAFFPGGYFPDPYFPFGYFPDASGVVISPPITVEEAIYFLLADDATTAALLSTHGLATADAVTLTTTTADLPDPLVIGTTYYARAVSGTTVTLHLTAADASANLNIINITDAGTGTHTCIPTGHRHEAFTFTADATDIVTSTRYRVGPVWLSAQSLLPAVAYQQISGPRIQSLDGPSGIAQVRIQVNSWATSYAAAHNLADEVRLVMDGRVGTIANWYIYDMDLIEDADMLNPSPGSEQKRAYGVRQDWVISHRETP